MLRERKEAEGSFAALARAIAEASGHRPGARSGAYVVDRRKLAALLDDRTDVGISLDEFAAFDRYLEPFGEGLAYQPLFEKQSLIELMAATERVTLLLGAKSLEDHWYFSHWDTLALAEIQRQLNSAPVRAKVDIRDVSRFAEFEETHESLKTGGWIELLDDDGLSLVCVGSSRTSPAAEAMLCRMFRREPYTARRAGDPQLPFHFVWNQRFDPFPSQFHLLPRDVAHLDAAGAEEIAGGDASAIALPDRLLVDRVNRSEVGDTYGVCAVQRRRGGQLHLVLAGITGPATLVAAKLVKQMATRLHEERRDRDSRVHWAVIKASVDPAPGVPFTSLRDFSEECVCSGPHVWPPREAG